MKECDQREIDWLRNSAHKETSYLMKSDLLPTSKELSFWQMLIKLPNKFEVKAMQKQQQYMLQRSLKIQNFMNLLEA